MGFRKYILFVFILLSYSQVLAQVDTAWVKRYNGVGSNLDAATALAVDGGGNVYVTGWSWGVLWDYATIKYASNGDTLWVRRYDGPGKNDYEGANAMTVDDSGNVYVTGVTTIDTFSGARWDYATLKYAPNGDTLWIRTYNGPANDYDGANAMAVDDSGNVYVTGYSIGIGTTYDYATIKYAPNGDTLWVRRYNGPGNDADGANAMAVDGSGNVYVTGHSIGSGTNYDYATIKYAPNGDTLWVRTYEGSGNDVDAANAIVVDGSGNVYVTGRSVGIGTSYDYATIKYAPNGDTLWVRRYNGPGNTTDSANALAVDGSGNVYVTGASVGSGNSFDYATIKYAPNGDTLRVRRYNGPGNGGDIANALAVDGSENVYVTGQSVGNGTYYDYATIKYAPNGDTLWVKRYNGLGNSIDKATALALDSADNVYVTGYSWGENEAWEDYTTIKYVQFSCLAKPGDTDADSTIQLSDIVTLVNYLFKSQPAPNPLCRADANADGNVLLPDIVYLINFLFKSGPAPIKSRECCL